MFQCHFYVLFEGGQCHRISEGKERGKITPLTSCAQSPTMKLLHQRKCFDACLLCPSKSYSRLTKPLDTLGNTLMLNSDFTSSSQGRFRRRAACSVTESSDKPRDCTSGWKHSSSLISTGCGFRSRGSPDMHRARWNRSSPLRTWRYVETGNAQYIANTSLH